jgi:outer membrane beta-barrel protein
MTRNGLSILFVFAVALLLQQVAWSAESVDLPREELAQESVLPIFDKPVSIKSRNINTTGRFDMNIFYGLAMTEPIGNVSKLGLGIYYNFNEDHALGLLYAKNSTGLSTYAEQLHSQFGTDFNRAPQQQSTTLIDYNIKAFYGKMSITKSVVFNTSLYGILSFGAVQYEHKSFQTMAIGFGQKFYFTNNFSLRADLRLFANQAPSPFLDGALKDGSKGPADPVPTASQFKERMTYSTNLDVGFSYLF